MRGWSRPFLQDMSLVPFMRAQARVPSKPNVGPLKEWDDVCTKSGVANIFGERDHAVERVMEFLARHERLTEAELTVTRKELAAAAQESKQAFIRVRDRLLHPFNPSK